MLNVDKFALWAQEVRNLIFKKKKRHSAATCSSSHWLQVAAKWLQVAAWASGCQVAASGCFGKWLQVAACGCKWLQVAVWASDNSTKRVVIFLCIGIGLKDIVHNIPPGVIDSPGLCDIDLAKTCKTTLNKNRNNNNQQQQQEQEQEEEEKQEEEGEEEEEQGKEQERIEQGEQWEQGEQDGKQNGEKEQEPQQEQEIEQYQEQEEKHNHKNKTKNKSLTFDHPWCYAVRSCPWFSNSFDATLSDHSLILQSSGLLPCKIWFLTCKSLLLRSKILSLTFKHVGLDATL